MTLPERSWFNEVGTVGDVTDAEARFAAFTAAAERRLAWLRARAGESGVAVDDSPESLTALLELAIARWGDGQPCDDPPVWYGPLERSWGMGCGGASWLDGLIHHVAAVFAARTGARWVLKRAEDPQEAFNLRPVMSQPRLAPPWRVVLGAAAQVRAGRRPPSGLADTVAYNLQLATTPPEPEDFGISLDPTAADGVFLATLSEEIPALLGDRLAALTADLAAVPAVRQIQWEDHEHLVVTAEPSTSAGQLEVALQAVVDRHLAET